MAYVQLPRTRRSAGVIPGKEPENKPLSTSPKFDRLIPHIADIAAARDEARQYGLDLPGDILDRFFPLRTQLRGAGLSRERIDSTPGLKLPEGVDDSIDDERCVRCSRPAPADADHTLTALKGEALDSNGSGWRCPDCMTAKERQATDEADRDLQ